MIGLLVGAAILGLIISVVERDEFPGWGKMVICVLATSIPSIIVNAIVPPELFIVGLVVGAICGGFTVMATCGSTVKRAAVVMGIYLGIQFVLSLLFFLLLR